MVCIEMEKEALELYGNYDIGKVPSGMGPASGNRKVFPFPRD